jgi:hypothetical protein
VTPPSFTLRYRASGLVQHRVHPTAAKARRRVTLKSLADVSQ